jgi:PAS domain S-box-containing protein
MTQKKKPAAQPKIRTPASSSRRTRQANGNKVTAAKPAKVIGTNQVTLQQEVLFQVLRALSGQLDADRVVQSAVETIVRLTSYPHVCIALPDKSEKHWVVCAAAGILAAEMGATYPVHQGIIGRVFQTGQVQWARDILLDPDYVRDVHTTEAPALRSEFVAPIRSGEILLGALNVESDRVDAFSESDTRMIQSVADIISLGLESARLYHKAQQEIAERRLAEQGMLESETSYRGLFNSVTEGIFIQNQQGRFQDVNPGALRMYGYSREFFIGKLPANLGAPGKNDKAMYERAFQKALGGEPQQFEFWGLRSNGEIFPQEILLSKGIYFGQDIVIALAHDITERKQVEETLRQNERKYRNLFNNSEVGMFRTRLDGSEILDFNEKYLEILGFTYDEIKGRPSVDLWANKLERDRMVQLLKDQGHVTDFEFVLLTKQGEQRTCITSSHLYPDQGILEGSIQDITERKQTQTLQKAVYQIASAAETTRSLDELYPQIHQIISSVMPAENFYITLYDEAENLLRFPYFMDAADQPFVDGLQPGKGLTAYVLRMGKSLLCTQAVHDELERQGEVKLLGVASAIWLGVPLIVEGKTIGVMVVQHYTDPNAYGEREQHMLEYVSTQVAIAIDRKRAEQKVKEYSERLEEMVEERTRELRQAQEKLLVQEKLAVLGQLAGGVGHELRNPLGVINTSIYYLKMVQPDASEKVRQHLAMIEHEVQNADKIISDLLDFARVISSDRQPVSVGEIVKHTLERFPLPETVKGTMDIPGDLPLVLADPRQLEQVLGNLTVNACQAMPDGGQLTISAIKIKEQVAITVKDTGTGITPENLLKIFEPLFTTKVKGIGLGLPVSMKLVEANGGRIEVNSQAGLGSTFTVYLPVQDK